MSDCITPGLLAATIIVKANRFVGLREIKPNANWDNPKTPGPDTALVKELRDLMLPTPWQDGWAYCAAFAEGVVAAAIADLGTPDQVAKFRAVMTAGVLDSRNRFRSRNLLSDTPAKGAIWLAQHGSTSKGHCGIVVDHWDRKLWTVEANTSLDSTDPAKDREGDWITRRGPFTSSGRGNLKTVGYVQPVSILQLINS